MSSPEEEGQAVESRLEHWDPKEALRSLTTEKMMDEEPEDTARRLFKENLPLAATSIVHLAVHCGNEKTRLTAAQYIIDRGFGRPTNTGDSAAATDIYRDFLADCVRESEQSDPVPPAGGGRTNSFGSGSSADE